MSVSFVFPFPDFYRTHSATLYLEDQPLTVQECHWGIVQQTDAQQRPQAGVLAGKISLVVDTLHHPVLDAWMADPHKRLSGLLVVHAADGLGTARRLRFVDALCINQGLTFLAGEGSRYAGSMSLLLSARELHVNEGLMIDNHWPE